MCFEILTHREIPQQDRHMCGLKKTQPCVQSKIEKREGIRLRI